jgi:transcriptional regulator with XRE-family HTH domain
MNEPNSLATIIGANIRKKREEWPSGWSQKFLAERAGINATMLAHYEIGDRVPTIENLLKLSEALSCTIDQLVKAETKHVLVTESFMYRAELALKVMDTIRELVVR